MKTLIIILLFITPTACYSQSDKFKAQLYIQDTIAVGGGALIFPLTSDTVNIKYSDTVTVIDLNNSNHRLFYFMWSGWVSKVFRFDNNITSSIVQKVNLPDTIFYKHFEEERICPICLKSKYLIPISYGLPLPKQFKLADKGKLRLGGCVYEFEKKYYCKKDDFEF
jgi:hypothetical protein